MAAHSFRFRPLVALAALLLFLGACGREDAPHPVTPPADEVMVETPDDGVDPASTGRPTFPNRTSYTQGEHLVSLNRGGRIAVWHNGWLYLPGTRVTTVYDLSDPRNPVKRNELEVGTNGHIYSRVGDVFTRGYLVPEITSQGIQHRVYLDLAKLPALEILDRNVGLHQRWGGSGGFPYLLNFMGGLRDQRTGQVYVEGYFRRAAGIVGRDMINVGNIALMAGGRSGVAAFDIGDPHNPRLLDVLDGAFETYTSTNLFVYSHYLVLMGGGTVIDGTTYNMVGIDFSDPANLRVAFKYTNSQIGGRYVSFQDHYAFAGGRKFDMNTGQTVQQFRRPSGNGSVPDFWNLPVGHLIVFSGAQDDPGDTHVFAHQNGLDTTPPTVAYHLPRPDAVNQPVTTTLGFVIHETLDSTTVNDQTIRVRPVGGQPVAGLAHVSSAGMVNFAPNQPLQPNTTYIVEVVPGGIKDAAGNGIVGMTYRFSTGASIDRSDEVAVTGLTATPASPVTVGTSVAFDVTATGATQYRFEFGDGTPRTNWSNARRASHTYRTPGTYTVVAQARSANGTIASRALTMLVQAPAVPPQPTRSSPIVLDVESRLVWTANADSDTVSIVHADRLERVREFAACARPAGIALTAGEAWISCGDDDRIVIHDASGTRLARIDLPYGANPGAIVTDPSGRTVFVSLEGTGAVLRFDARDRRQTGRLDVGTFPRAMAVSADGSELILTHLVASEEGGRVRRVALGTFDGIQNWRIPNDTTTVDGEVSSRGIANYLVGLAISPAGGRVWVSGKKDNIYRGSFVDGQALTFETASRALVSVLEAGSEVVHRELDDHALPSAIAFDPYGTFAFVTMQANDRILALNGRNAAELARADTGAAPNGLVFDPVTKRLFVSDFLGRSVSVFDASSLLQDGRGDLPLVRRIAGVARETLAADVLQGKRLFYNARDERLAMDGYLSCASCHLDGGNDGRTWDFTNFGEGLRRTLDLRGRGGRTPFHWSANFDEVQDFEGQIRNFSRGTGLLTDSQFHAGTRRDPLGDPKAGLSADLDALAAYVTSLERLPRSPFRGASGDLTTAGQRGRATFERLACHSCHGGEHWTDDRLHDVGTITRASGTRLGEPLTGIRTPSLRGLWLYRSFGHDGAAVDLTNFFDRAPSGSVHRLSLGSSDLTDLVAFLRQIDDREASFPLPTPPAPSPQEPGDPGAPGEPGTPGGPETPAPGEGLPVDDCRNVPAAFPLRVNFAPREVVLDEPHLHDWGATHGTHCGFTYGWSERLEDQMRSRESEASPDAYHDTLVYLQKPQTKRDVNWRIALPNGRYSVRIVMGDPTHQSGTFVFDLNGVEVRGTPSRRDPWVDRTVEIRVRDGALRIRNGDKAKNNKIAFLHIVPLEGQVLK